MKTMYELTFSLLGILFISFAGSVIFKSLWWLLTGEWWSWDDEGAYWGF